MASFSKDFHHREKKTFSMTFTEKQLRGTGRAISSNAIFDEIARILVKSFVRPASCSWLRFVLCCVKLRESMCFVIKQITYQIFTNNR